MRSREGRARAVLRVADAAEANAIWAERQRLLPPVRSSCLPSGAMTGGGIVAAAVGVVPGGVAGALSGMAVIGVAVPIAVLTACLVVTGPLTFVAGYFGAFAAIGFAAARVTGWFARLGRNQNPTVAALAAAASAVLGSAVLTAVPWIVHPIVGAPQPVDSGLLLLLRTVLNPAPFLIVLGVLGAALAVAFAVRGARTDFWTGRFCPTCGRPLRAHALPGASFGPQLDELLACAQREDFEGVANALAGQQSAGIEVTLHTCRPCETGFLEAMARIDFDWPGRRSNQNPTTLWLVLSRAVGGEGLRRLHAIERR